MIFCFLFLCCVLTDLLEFVAPVPPQWSEASGFWGPSSAWVILPADCFLFWSHSVLPLLYDNLHMFVRMWVEFSWMQRFSYHFSYFTFNGCQAPFYVINVRDENNFIWQTLCSFYWLVVFEQFAMKGATMTTACDTVPTEKIAFLLLAPPPAAIEFSASAAVSSDTEFSLWVPPCCSLKWLQLHFKA